MDFEKRIQRLEDFLIGNRDDDFYHKQYHFLQEIEESIEGDPNITSEGKEKMFQDIYGTLEEFVEDQELQSKHRNYNH